MESQDITSQPNVEAVTTESAPVTETITETAVQAESAPAETNALDQNTEQEGSEPPSKAVRDLIQQRKRRQAAEQEAAYWRGVAEAKGNSPTVEQPKPAPVQQQPEVLKAPSSDQFETWEAYEQAKDEYLVAKARQSVIQEMQKAQAQQQQAKVQSTFWEKVEQIEDNDDPMIRETIKNVGNMVSPVVADLVVQSDDGIELVKYLNNNRKEALRISQLPPLAAAKAIGKIEASLAAKPKVEPPKKVSQAPAPIKTVTPAGSVDTFNPETASMEEYYKRRMTQLRPKLH
jgi:hypothetical protein